MGNFWHQRIVGVGVCQERAYRQQHFRNGECRAPLVLQDVKADSTIAVDVGVVQFRREVHLRRLERVVCWEVHFQEKDSPSERAVRRAHDCGLPVEEVVPNRASTAIGWRILPQVKKLFVDSLKCHVLPSNGNQKLGRKKDYLPSQVPGSKRPTPQAGIMQIQLTDWQGIVFMMTDAGFDLCSVFSLRKREKQRERRGRRLPS